MIFNLLIGLAMTDTSRSAATATPLGARQQRIVSLDIIRGVAVLGIAFANIVAMGQPFVAYTWPGGFLTPADPWGDMLWAVQFVLIDGKFRALFTLLFGAGMVLFYQRALEKGAGVGLLARRLVWLGLFGFLHWLLLYRGDILLTYAVAGLIVIWAVDWPWTRQLVLGLIGYAWGAAINWFGNASLIRTGNGATGANDLSLAALESAKTGAIADGTLEAKLRLAGSYADIVRHNIEVHLPEIPGNILYVLPETIPLILIGMGLLGAGLYEKPANLKRFRMAGWALWLGGSVGAALIAWWAVAGGLGYWESVAAFNGWLPVPQLASALGMLALLALWGSQACGWLARRLAAAGRCAFSNYIGTSAAGLAIFAGWGLGLFGSLDRAQLYGVAAVLCLAMISWPLPWLERFRHGPMEWLWRCLTYGRYLPNRRF